MQADLFGAPASAVPVVMQDIISAVEERRLLAALQAVELQPFRFQQWEGRRLTRTYGWKYDFGAGTFEPAAAIPGFLLPLRERAAAFAGLDAPLFVQALVTLYEPGAGIGWHRDRPEFEDVVGISLGAPATMRFRRRLANGKFQRLGLAMAPRSAYHLAGEFRHEWEHSIAPMTARRWSVTFRRLSARGLARERDVTSSRTSPGGRSGA
ncbi:2OG-Fe(II) oxygenase [Bordetella genomosp. 8]|uniref:2OG-Fe(II) oxygenase n=1 Tax=Bordetella genomosp. 8 TaxID=1416806 RepID=A0A1W6YGP6_9BORD|nr:alpha-ketoglutarate-dependent dioxygenase AlkB [Bordetella genomosp. 8]ARP80212.1 2OG-Fe(II) oxygenase [Bordetella genomosp. 8]